MLNRPESSDPATSAATGQDMYDLLVRLFPICRSITGPGVRETLRILKEYVPALMVHEVPTGTKCFDWTVPDEWTIRDAYIVTPDGRRIAEFKKNNLHVMAYSVPVDQMLGLEELQQHLHSIPEYPDAIPYEASFYTPQWGFSLTHNERSTLIDGNYRVFIDSTIAPGSLSYGEVVIPGETTDEIFLSTYTCHPSMANNELSGSVVSVFLARWISSLPRRRFTYRFVYGPETIGAIVYLSRHLAHLKRHVVAAFNLSCLGDDRAYSYIPSRNENTASDRVALHVLKHLAPGFGHYTYMDRGSDERQYCSPGVDLPMATVMRTKYGNYPEYHTSRDDLTVVSPAGLEGGFNALRLCLTCLEGNLTYRSLTLGEPQLGKRGLYNTKVQRNWNDGKPLGRVICDLMSYCDGEHDLLAVADKIHQPMWKLIDIAALLVRESLLEQLE